MGKAPGQQALNRLLRFGYSIKKTKYGLWLCHGFRIKKGGLALPGKRTDIGPAQL